MAEIVLFGGTSEGRELALALNTAGLETLVSVATDYGALFVSPGEHLRLRVGRLDLEEMRELLQSEAPRLVLDATHPYATVVSENLRLICTELGLKLMRVLREELEVEGCHSFRNLEEAIAWMNSREGIIFSTLGVKEARELTGVHHFQERLRMRILPSPEGLNECVELAYPMKNLILMQGPFSYELNKAMFQASAASILLTKESGVGGGFSEKIQAARDLEMEIAVIMRPTTESGLDLGAVLQLISEGKL